MEKCIMTLKKMTVNEFLSGKYKVGNKTKQSRVAKIVKEFNPHTFMNHPQNLITITNSKYISQGNHRFMALKDLMASGVLTGDEEFYFLEHTDMGANENHKLSFIANTGTNKTNYRQHAINGSSLASRRLYKPLTKIFDEIEHPFADTRVELLVMRISALLNENPEWFKMRDFMPMTGAALYQAKGYPLANMDIFNESITINIDINNHIEKLTKLIKPAFSILKELYDSGEYKHYFNGNTTFQYILIAQALNGGLLRKGVTYKKLSASLKKAGNGQHVNNILKKDFVTDPIGAEVAILGRLFGG